jgi:hypothetical protein
MLSTIAIEKSSAEEISLFAAGRLAQHLLNLATSGVGEEEEGRTVAKRSITSPRRSSV